MKKIIIFFCVFILQITILQGEESVICLHGFFRSSKCMIPMRSNLKKAGFAVYLWDYQGRKETIENHAENLVKMLKTIAAKNPGKPIHFTTHSLGGIILRAAVNHPDCPQEAKIGKAVLLAPPNKGAHLARHFQNCPVINLIFGKKSGKQLLTYEEEDMERLGSFPSEMKVMVVAGDKKSHFFQFWVKEPNDGKVTVEETRLSTPHIHRTFYVSHNWIMTSREVINLTTDFLLGLFSFDLGTPN